MTAPFSSLSIIAGILFLLIGLYPALMLPGAAVGTFKHLGALALCGVSLVVLGVHILRMPGAFGIAMRTLRSSLITPPLLLLLASTGVSFLLGSLWSQLHAAPFEAQSVAVTLAIFSVASVVLALRGLGVSPRLFVICSVLGGVLSLTAGLAVSVTGVLQDMTPAGAPFIFSLHAGFVTLLCLMVTDDTSYGRTVRTIAFCGVLVGLCSLIAAFSVAVWISVLLCAIVHVALRTYLSSPRTSRSISGVRMLVVCVALIGSLTPQIMGDKIAWVSAVEIQPTWSASLLAVGRFATHADPSSLLFGGGAESFRTAWIEQQSQFGGEGGDIEFDSATSWVLTTVTVLGVVGTVALLWLYAAHLTAAVRSYTAALAQHAEIYNPLVLPALFLIGWSMWYVLTPVLILLMCAAIVMSEDIPLPRV